MRPAHLGVREEGGMRGPGALSCVRCIRHPLFSCGALPRLGGGADARPGGAGAIVGTREVPCPGRARARCVAVCWTTASR